jgi:hypothetical protein
MARTTSTLVGEIVEVDVRIGLDPFIGAASLLVDSIDEKDLLNGAALTIIETWLAAHFYCMRDPSASPVSERAGPVAATYQSAVALNLSSTRYGQMAMTLDTTGTLKAISKGKVSVKLTWLGTALET